MFTYAETLDEFKTLKDDLDHYLRSIELANILGERLATEVADFVNTSLVPDADYSAKYSWLRILNFDNTTTNMVEQQNSAIKHCAIPVTSNMSIDKSAAHITHIMHNKENQDGIITARSLF